MVVEVEKTLKFGAACSVRARNMSCVQVFNTVPASVPISLFENPVEVDREIAGKANVGAPSSALLYVMLASSAVEVAVHKMHKLHNDFSKKFFATS
jgi:hypothetical protein